MTHRVSGAGSLQTGVTTEGNHMPGYDPAVECDGHVVSFALQERHTSIDMLNKHEKAYSIVICNTFSQLVR